MKMFTRILFVLILLQFSGLCLAQMTGNPAGVRGAGEWTIAVDGTYMTHELSSETDITRRLFAKSGWGLTPWLDIYGLIGGVQLEIRPDDVGFTNYKDKLRLGFGVGLNIAYPSPLTHRFSFWANGQFMRFASEGIFESLATSGYSQEFHMNYDWREFRANIGVIIPLSFIRIYLAGTGWSIQRLENKEEYVNISGSLQYIGEEDGEYRSGFWTGAMLGLEFVLPMHYTIGIEMTYFNATNYFIVAGVSQTGILSW